MCSATKPDHAISEYLPEDYLKEERIMVMPLSGLWSSASSEGVPVVPAEFVCPVVVQCARHPVSGLYR
jgi:hypothetical protein